MPEIVLLDEETIDKIAAGEVVERPSSVVKELVENAIDAKSSAVTVEIKEGGLSFIRITDNGCGIKKEQVALAFLRHSTSKIRSATDLLDIHSLGFRGEALSSIAAVSQVELITKTYDQLTGTKYIIEGSKEISCEEVGAPDGTTFLVRNLFYNVPARRKFLKTAATESGYISDIMEHMALSHPNLSFKFINNGQTKLHTSGNGNEKDVIYHIYGRDITSALLKVETETELFSIKGFIGKPMVSRGNRNYESYFINGRYIKSKLIASAIEEAYKGFLMQHQYPFCVLSIQMNPELLDVNVHPTKMELRFSRQEEIYHTLYEVIKNTLCRQEMIPQVPLQEERKTAAATEKTELEIPKKTEKMDAECLEQTENIPGMQEQIPGFKENNARRKSEDAFFSKLKNKKEDAILTVQEEHLFQTPLSDHVLSSAKKEFETSSTVENVENKDIFQETPMPVSYEQQRIEDSAVPFLSEQAKKKHHIIGQLFDTYWLVEYEDKLFILDQHAAHEKVLYERMMKHISEKQFFSQRLSPPVILTLNREEQLSLEKYRKQIEIFGYEIEPFGGNEYAITAVPADFTEIDMRILFLEMLNDFSTISEKTAPDTLLEKVASMSCKAAVKGNHRLSVKEMEILIEELLLLEDPYHCPHGRPTIISMTKYEIEKKFKRIV